MNFWKDSRSYRTTDRKHGCANDVAHRNSHKRAACGCAPTGWRQKCIGGAFFCLVMIAFAFFRVDCIVSAIIFGWSVHWNKRFYCTCWIWNIVCNHTCDSFWILASEVDRTLGWRDRTVHDFFLTVNERRLFRVRFHRFVFLFSFGNFWHTNFAIGRLLFLSLTSRLGMCCWSVASR